MRASSGGVPCCRNRTGAAPAAAVRLSRGGGAAARCVPGVPYCGRRLRSRPRSVIRAAVDFASGERKRLVAGESCSKRSNFIFLVFTLSVNDLLSMCREGGRAGSLGAALGSARPEVPVGRSSAAEPPLCDAIAGRRVAVPGTASCLRFLQNEGSAASLCTPSLQSFILV